MHFAPSYNGFFTTFVLNNLYDFFKHFLSKILIFFYKFLKKFVIIVI